MSTCAGTQYLAYKVQFLGWKFPFTIHQTTEKFQRYFIHANSKAVQKQLMKSAPKALIFNRYLFLFGKSRPEITRRSTGKTNLNCCKYSNSPNEDKLKGGCAVLMV